MVSLCLGKVCFRKSLIMQFQIFVLIPQILFYFFYGCLYFIYLRKNCLKKQIWGWLACSLNKVYPTEFTVVCQIITRRLSACVHGHTLQLRRRNLFLIRWLVFASYISAPYIKSKILCTGDSCRRFRHNTFHFTATLLSKSCYCSSFGFRISRIT